MNGKPSNAREALLAELLGDVQALLARLEQADQSAKATAAAVTDATAQYRGQVDELVSKLRTETASIVLKTTEHAAQSLVGQQQATLQKAATQAMQQALSEQVLRRTRRDWMLAVICSGITASVVTLGLLSLR
jgi:hypothetical protein